ncbi:MAG TPA: hypothetical protein VFY65_00370 [Longimicrobium sp.]|nr:hypothetical protein [Longimicrobium sp.]
MRFKISIAATLIIAGIQATDAAAQTEANPQPTALSTVAPLPASLTPDTAPAGEEASARISVRRVFVSAGIGTLVGAGAGLLVGAVTSDGCRPNEDWCILGWEEEVAIVGIAGAMAGAGIGAIYGLVTSPRQARTEPAPITVAPSTGGSVRVGLTLRH